MNHIVVTIYTQQWKHVGELEPRDIGVSLASDEEQAQICLDEASAEGYYACAYPMQEEAVRALTASNPQVSEALPDLLGDLPSEVPTHQPTQQKPSPFAQGSAEESALRNAQSIVSNGGSIDEALDVGATAMYSVLVQSGLPSTSAATLASNWIEAARQVLA